MTFEEKQTLEALALFAIQHVPCGLVEQTYRLDGEDVVMIYTSCPGCGASTRGSVTVAALSEQLRESLRGTGR
jgi:hypothetical protein